MGIQVNQVMWLKSLDLISIPAKKPITGPKNQPITIIGVCAIDNTKPNCGIGIDCYGYSGKSRDVMKKLALDPNDVAKNIMKKYKEL